MKAFKLIIATFYLVSVLSCETDEDYSVFMNQEVVFQFEYINHAWGKQHRGFFVLNDGSIYKYDNPEGWVFPSQKNNISTDDFNNNLSKATEKVGTVNANKMLEMKALINKFDKENLTEMESVMADAGAESYSFYLKSGSQDYQNYLLLMRGDNFQKNSDKDAEQLADWLIQLNDGGIFNEEFFD